MIVERATHASLIDVLDRVLDKGIVIDAWVRVSLAGIDLMTLQARIFVASIEDRVLNRAAARRLRPRWRPRRSRRRAGASRRDALRRDAAPRPDAPSSEPVMASRHVPRLVLGNAAGTRAGRRRTPGRARARSRMGSDLSHRAAGVRRRDRAAADTAMADGARVPAAERLRGDGLPRPDRLRAGARRHHRRQAGPLPRHRRGFAGAGDSGVARAGAAVAVGVRAPRHRRRGVRNAWNGWRRARRRPSLAGRRFAARARRRSSRSRR
ncbi:MAG: hypothetical protein DMF85_05170 [Acidobacteria bacterium]|nr:MAG: hypothetical protein DMF85_05170 [Acidobacteriota bacterium]